MLISTAHAQAFGGPPGCCGGDLIPGFGAAFGLLLIIAVIVICLLARKS